MVLAALFGGLAITAVTAPFMRPQILLQTQDLVPKLRFGNPITGIFNGISRIYKDEGASHLWRGFFPLYMGTILTKTSSMLRLSTFEDIEKVEPKENVKDVSNNEEENKDKLIKFTRIKIPSSFGSLELTEKDNKNLLFTPGLSLSGFSVALSMVFQPFNVLYVRMVTDYADKLTNKYAGVWNTAKTLVKTEGLKALYKGFVPMTIYHLLHTHSSSFVLDKETDDIKKTVMMLFREFILFPLIVIGNRMIMEIGNPLAGFKGMIECTKKTYQNFGVKGFFRGFQVVFFLYASKLTTDIYKKIKNESKE